MLDLAVNIGAPGVTYYVGLVVGRVYAPNVDRASRNARALGVALEREVIVWPVLDPKDMPVAPETIRAHAKKVLSELTEKG